MRYKSNVQEEIDNIYNMVHNLSKNLQKQNVSAEETVQFLERMKGRLENVQKWVELEDQDPRMT